MTKNARVFEESDVILTLNDDGSIRFWRVTDAGDLVEYEGYPVDAD